MGPSSRASTGPFVAPSPALPAATSALDLAPRVALGDGLALVVSLPAAGDTEQQLRIAVGEVELERDDGVALARHRRLELLDLGAVQEELAGAHRVGVPAV